MKILCKHQRKGGTVVPFSHPGKPDYRQYAFKPNKEGDHVCEVDDEQDIQTFLAIDSAYVEYQPKSATEAAASATGSEQPAASPLDSMTRPELAEVAKAQGVKLDESHTDDQVRHYLKGLNSTKKG